MQADEQTVLYLSNWSRRDSWAINRKVWEALDLYGAFYDHPADWEALVEHLGLAEKRNYAVSLALRRADQIVQSPS